MTKLEEVARAWNAEFIRWRVRECGKEWIVCRETDEVTGETYKTLASVKSMLGADKRMFALRDLACARAAVKALREPTEAMLAEAWASALGEDAAAVWCDMIDAVLTETTGGE